MNLHGIVAGAVSAVNPMVVVTVQVSAGSVPSPAGDGTRVPVYLRAQRVRAQIQPMSWGDLRQVEGLNLQGSKQSIYLYGKVDGLIRVDNKGGDLITDSDGHVWLVVQPLEQWPDWCKVAVTLQDQLAPEEN